MASPRPSCCRECPGLALQERVDVDRGERIGRPPVRHHAVQRTGAAADVQHRLARLRRHVLDQAAHHGAVAWRLRAVLQRRDAADMAPAQRHDGEVARQQRDGRVPLRRGEEERQQHQGWPRPLDAVGDAGDHPLGRDARLIGSARGIGGDGRGIGSARRLGSDARGLGRHAGARRPSPGIGGDARGIGSAARGIGGKARQVGGDPAGDDSAAVGNHVGPAGRLVAVQHMASGPWQPRQRPRRNVVGQVAVAGDHQQAFGDAGERCGVEPRRHAQHDACDALRRRRNKAGEIARHLRGHMRGAQTEMVPQCHQPLR